MSQLGGIQADEHVPKMADAATAAALEAKTAAEIGTIGTASWVGGDVTSFEYLKTTAGVVNTAIQASFAAGNIAVGEVIRTGSYIQGRGAGTGTYQVTAAATGTDDGGSFIDFTGFQLQALFGDSIEAAQFGVVADNVTDDQPALQAAINYVQSQGGGEVRLPAATMRLDADLVISENDVRLTGRGQQTILRFRGVKLHIDSTANTADNLRRFNLADFAVIRDTAPGPAIHFDGVSAGAIGTWEATSRWDVSNVHVLSSAGGQGWLIHDSYLGQFRNCYTLACDVGWQIQRQPGGSVSANAITWVGGEVQGCRIGVEIDNTAGAGFYGMAIEGNSESGFDTYGNNRNLVLLGCYFESNGNSQGAAGRHIRIGLASAWGSESGISVKDSLFFRGGATDSAVDINRGVGVHFEGNTYLGYPVAPIANLDPGSAVFGWTHGDRKNGSTAIPMLSGATTDFFVATHGPATAQTTVWYKHSSPPAATFAAGDRCLFTEQRADNNGAGNISLNGGTDTIQLAADTGEYEVTVFADTEAPATGDSTSVTVLVDGAGFTIMDIALTGNQVGSWQSLIDTTGAAKTVEVNRAVITGTGRLDVQVKVAGLG